MAKAATAYENLLSPGRIGALELRNRIVMSPMGSNLAESDGTMGERIKAYYEARARGGAGLLVAGVGAIAHPAGACNRNQVGISDDSFLPGLEDFAGRVHAHGARVAIQLQHAGKVATRDIAAGRPMWVPSAPTFRPLDLYDDLTDAERAEATAFMREPAAKAAFHEMTSDDIAWLVERFAEAACRARRAGLDAVEVHAGHGYLIAGFLSPAANRRVDAYGGALENRARLLCEIISAIKCRAGAEFPVWCRLDGTELRIDGGITIDDACGAARLAELAGADAVHVSAYADSSVGAAFTQAPLVEEPGGFVDLAAAVKSRVGVPVIAVGRIEPETADALIAEGKADFVAMGRKLLADPELPIKLAAGRGAQVRPCIYGYTCVGRIFLNRENRCAANPVTGREHEVAIEPTAAPRRVLVVGGGPGGMETARVAALRGHDVTLVEARGRLGGALAASASVHAPNGDLVRYLADAVERAGVRVALGRRADAALVGALGADSVVLATGADYEPVAPPPHDRAAPELVGADELAERLGSRDAPPWRRVVLVGGGLEGLALADALTRAGVEALVAEPGETLGVGMAPPRRWRVLAALRERAVPLLVRARVDLAGGTVRVVAQGEARTMRADAVVGCLAPSPRGELAGALAATGVELRTVGECGGARYVEAVMVDAMRTALAL